MRKALRCAFALAFIASFAGIALHAQTRDPRVITVRAGGVNFVSGDVQFQSIGESGWQKLNSKVDLKSGDLVKSGIGGRAEVLLNPGSYVRLGENSEFELEDTTLDSLRVKLYKGSAVVEATGYDGVSLEMAFDTPQTTTRIVQRGVYRFNVTADNVTEVIVQRGKILVGPEPSTTVTGGKFVRIAGSGGRADVAKFDKKNRDYLDLWSKSRAEELARINRSLQMRNTRAMIAATDFSRFGRFSTLGALGIWIFDASFGCYTFLPFYYGWQSPYGGWYGSYWAYSPLCGSCGYRGYRRNTTWGNNPGWPSDTYNPSFKTNPPVVNAPNPVTNPIPVTRDSGGGTFSTSGKSKP
jgi:hypothetical protein